MKEMTKTKQRVFDAAVSLINTKGFNGTSVRDIAKKANVNVALISYYFGGKKGLLEQLLTSFLEGHLKILDEVYEKSNQENAKKCLLEMVYRVLQYESEHHQLARLVHREITLDTVLIREVMSTYLTKEKYYFKSVLELGMESGQFRKIPTSITIMQLKSMLTMPYLHPQYMVEVLHVTPSEKYFTDRYYDQLKNWVEEDLSLSVPKPSLSLVEMM